MIASAILSTVVCWGGGSMERDKKRLSKLVKRASSVLANPLDSIEEVGERRMLAKLMSIMVNTSHPLQETTEAPCSSFSGRLVHPHCKKECYCRPFIPTSVRLFNTLILYCELRLYLSPLLIYHPHHCYHKCTLSDMCICSYVYVSNF